jgi:hypothetical protein
VKLALRLAALLLVVLAPLACRTTQTIVDGGVDDASRRTVEAFLSAVRAGNTQGVSDLWGTKDGPAREHMDRTEHDQRLFVIIRCLRNDSAVVKGEMPGTSGGRIMLVELYRGTVMRQTSFTTVRGPARWYVEQIDMEPVRDLCAIR